MRAFIAVDISPEVRSNIKVGMEDLRKLGMDMKHVKPESVHLTIKFLGEMDDDLVPIIAESMDAIAGAQRPLELRARGMGCFPNPGKPRVAWVGCEDPAKAAEGLAGRVEDEMAGLGFEKEARGFKTHLTIGRFRDGERGGPAFLRFLEANSKRDFGAFVAGELILFKSVLLPDGAVYSSVHRAKFRGD
jgi:2'-5' RNA ligase